MVKRQQKDASSFQNIYGDGLIFNINKNNGSLKVSIKNESSAFTQNTFFICCICVIGVPLSKILNRHMCLISIGFLLMLYILYKLFLIREEEILIVKGFGCQISQKHILGKSTMFFPYEKIENVFINEVIFRNRIIYLLTLSTKEKTKEQKDSHKLVTLFMNLLPRIDCLQIIYKSIKSLESR